MPKIGKRGITFIVIAAIAVIALIVYKIKTPDVTYETDLVSVGTVVEKISVTGSIAAKTTVNLQAETSAKVSAIDVNAGDEVEEGDLLVSLNAADLSARISGQQAAVEAAEALLRQYRAGATQEELDVSYASVESAKARYSASLTAKEDAERALRNAENSRETVLSKVDVNLQTKADALIQAYDSGLTTALDSINRLTSAMYTGNDQLTFVTSNYQASSDAMNTRLSARSAIAEMESKILTVKAAWTAEAATAAYQTFYSGMQAVKLHIDASADVLNYANSLDSTTRSSYQLNVSTAQSSMNINIQAVTVAKNALDLQEQLNDADVTNAETAVNSATTSFNNAVHAVETAEKSVAQSEADYNYRKAGVRPEQIAAQEARVKAEKASLSSLYADYAKRMIRAPIDGIVTDVSVEVGESAQIGQPIVSMNTKGRFEIIANISEVDVAKIAAGQTVSVTLDAFPSSEVWTGKVATVNPAEKVVSGVIFYETKIVFDDDDQRLRAGLTANLDIEVGRADDVTRIPIRALQETVGRKFVRVMIDGKIQERDITIGLENTDYIEVISGLSPDEEVVIGSVK